MGRSCRLCLCHLQAVGHQPSTRTGSPTGLSSTQYHKRVNTAVEVIIGLKPELVISAGDMVAGQKQPLLAQHKVDFFISGHHHVYYPELDANGVGHLGVGPLGGNARKIVGRSSREPFSFAVLDAGESGFRVSARKAPDFIADIPLSGLPVQIRGPLGSLQRIDHSSHE